MDHHLISVLRCIFFDEPFLNVFVFNLSLFLCSTILVVYGWQQHTAVLVFSVHSLWNNL